MVMLLDGRMDTPNAVRSLGRVPKTLTNMCSDGTGPAFIKCSRIFYYRTNLDAWLAKAPRCTSAAQCQYLTVAE
jgi:hypothetical protein